MSNENKENLLQGTVLEIQRMSTEDGPGIRTTVFLKGCSLNCTWCHNPESISQEPQVQWIASRCIGCEECLDVCSDGAISHGPEGVVINRDVCNGCGLCTEKCPSTALELLGTKWGVGDLINELIKDLSFFEKSGGGVTLSGGEPTMQARFSSNLLKGLKARGIHTALDTCGLCSREALDMLLPYSTMVLFDVKEIDPQRHQLFTGKTNEQILANLLYVSDYIRTHLIPGKLWIRTPLIPGTTATVENIRGISDFIASNLTDVTDRWDLCSFNNLCRDKYQRLGLEWAFKESGLLSESFLDSLIVAAKNSGVNPDLVRWSGSTRIEAEKLGGYPTV